jgi:hypothetical protein
MALRSYAGWDGPTRARRLAELRQAKVAGTAPQWVHHVSPCEICGQKRGTMWHAEQYGPTFAAYIASFHAVCGHCHAMLHLRFRFPGRWRLHLMLAALGPVPFMAHVGVVFGRARTWVSDLSAESYRPGREWFHSLPMTR